MSWAEPAWQSSSAVINSVIASPNKLITLHAPSCMESDSTSRLSLWDTETSRLISTQKYNSSLRVIEATASDASTVGDCEEFVWL